MTTGSAPSRSAHITRYTHSCVRIERDSTVLVIDPGIWSEPSALHDADAVLVTHEHSDHIDVLRLAGLGVPVYAPADARISGLDVIRVASGESFTVAGFTVTTAGTRHASVFEDEPDCANHGYIIDDRIYHPGDALFVPGQPVETLFVPLQASWLKTAEAISFLRAVRPERAFGIHDAQINSRGLQAANSWLTDQGGHGYRYLAPGEGFDLLWRARISGLGCLLAGRELRPSCRLPWTSSPGRLTEWLNCLSIWPGRETAALTSGTRCSATCARARAAGPRGAAPAARGTDRCATPQSELLAAAPDAS